MIFSRPITFGAQEIFYSYEIPYAMHFWSNEELSFTPTATGTMTTMTNNVWLRSYRIDNPNYNKIWEVRKVTGGTDPLVRFRLNSVTSPPKFQVHKMNLGNPVGTYGAEFSVTFDKGLWDNTGWVNTHLVIDTTQGIDTNRIRLWVNGEEASPEAGATWPDQDQEIFINGPNTHYIAFYPGGTEGWAGSMADFIWLDGKAEFDVTKFTNTKNAICIPRNYDDNEYGINGTRLKFTDDANLGADSSGLGNDYDDSSLSSSKQITDTPTSTYCVMNNWHGQVDDVSQASGPTIDGITTTSVWTGLWVPTQTIPFPSTGKWYCELTLTADTTHNETMFGLRGINADPHIYTEEPHIYITLNYPSGTEKTINGVTTTYNTDHFLTNDVISMALSMEDGQVQFYINGSGQGWINLPDTNTQYSIFIHDTQDADNSTYEINFGQRPFSYTAPTGYKELYLFNTVCNIKVPHDHIGCLTWSGTGAANAVIDGDEINFIPDWALIKSESTGDWSVFDSTRGSTKYLIPNSSGIEVTDAQTITSFADGGVNLGTSSVVNANGETFHGLFMEEGLGVGFEIVEWQGDGQTYQAVSTTLGQGADCIMAKNRDASDDWYVGFSTTNSGTDPWDYHLNLNSDAPQTEDINTWRDEAPAADAFKAGSNINANGEDYIAYLWHSVPGYSKVFMYKGNGDSDRGAYVYTGFSPMAAIIKCTSASGSWNYFDKHCYTGLSMYADEGFHMNTTSGIADTGNYIHWLSQGFRIASAGDDLNVDGEMYVGIAWAEQPGKYASGRS